MDNGGGYQLQAVFVYDSRGERVRQVNYSGTQPMTTTYVNDAVGLTQVLAADDGTSRVTNLFGLDLIAQDDGQADNLYLLTDSLGSVRQEMRGVVWQASTTYSPYGEVLTQGGTSATNCARTAVACGCVGN